MRQIISVLLALVVLFTTAVASAAQGPAVRVFVNGAEVQADVQPFTEEGRTLVPVRALAEKLGFEVAYAEADGKITLTRGATVVVLWAGSNKVLVNGKESTIAVPARVVNGRAFVPVRFVAEALGTHVAWDSHENAARVMSGNAMLERIQKQNLTLTSQKTTIDMQVMVELTNPKQPGGSMIFKVPVYMDMHMHQNDLLMNMTMQLPIPMPGLSDGPLSMQMAIRDGKAYMKDPTTGHWTEGGPVTFSQMQDLMKAPEFAALMNFQSEILKDMSVTIAGTEELDGVKVVRLDIDMSKLDVMDLLKKVTTALKISASELGEIPDIKVDINKFAISYWINPETFFAQKSTADADVAITVTEDGQPMTIRVGMTMDMKSSPSTEKVEFPADMLAPVATLSAEEMQALQTYWTWLTQETNPSACQQYDQKIQAAWTAKDYAAGKEAAAEGAECATNLVESFKTVTPPKQTQEAHLALLQSAGAYQRAFTAYTAAFELAEKGDMAGADARKAEAAADVQTATVAMVKGISAVVQLAAQYELK